jgi:predicted metal-dependent phosphoesterase TrpH
MRYDLHMHSDASPDCATKLSSLIAVARRRGLAGIALTDHDTMEGVRRLQAIWPHDELHLIPGCERTLTDGSHLIGLFLTEAPVSETPLEVIAEIRAQGGIVYLPHPYRAYSGLLGATSGFSEDEQKRVLEQCDIIEVYNSKCTVDENQRALKLIEQRSKAFAASSDAHFAHEIGTACTEYERPLSPASFVSVAAYAPPKSAAERLAKLRRGIESPARKQARRAADALGFLSALKSVRNGVRCHVNPALERYL